MQSLWRFLCHYVFLSGDLPITHIMFHVVFSLLFTFCVGMWGFVSIFSCVVLAISGDYSIHLTLV